MDLRHPPALLLLLLAGAVFAHGDDDAPLYVAGNGVDRGPCLDPAHPCRTLAYVLRQTGKSGRIEAGPGRLAIGDPETLFHLVSGAVGIRGGFGAGFLEPGVQRTTLTSVPPEYREYFANRGFHVLADRKGDAEDPATRALVELHAAMAQSLGAGPCTGGQSGGLDCDRVSLLAHVPFGEVSARPAAAADLWGYADLNTRREYVIVGYNIGTAVFDVTDPGNPREVGFIDGRNTSWRDIKVYQHFDPDAGRWMAYAYITTDGSSDGLFVVDLRGLPHSVAQLGYASDFTAAHNVFIANTDYGTGLSLTGAPNLVIAGSNNGGGRYRGYALSNPAAPAFSAMPAPSAGDYMHDAASIIVRDSRKDSACPNATDYCEVLFDFNESTVDTWDITNGVAAVRLGRTPYEQAAYTHSGWPSEDGRYLYVHDELDEQSFGLQTTVRVFSLEDLAHPVLAGQWSGPSRAIDHNGFVRGNRYYLSNYSRGLTVLDLSDPVVPVQVGMFDTYPFSNSASFVGAWGVYPFLPSGTLAVSDISSGLYLLRDETLGSPAGTLSFTAAAFGGEEGRSIPVGVARHGGSAGAVSVRLEVVPATADRDDVRGAETVLSWDDGEAGPKSVPFEALPDGSDEGLEFVLVRLLAPAGGATLAPASLADLYIAESGAPSTVGFSTTETVVAERGFGSAVIVVQRLGNSAGAVTVDWSVGSGDAAAGADYEGPANGQLRWADGDARPQWIEFRILDDGIAEADEFFELQLSAVNGAVVGERPATRVTLLDGAGANTAPNAVAGPHLTTTGGAAVALDGSSSNDPDGDALDYAWQQSLGPAVALQDADTARAGFTAPAVTSDTLLRFDLTVRDPRGLSDTAAVNVTVQAPGQGRGSGGGAAGLSSLLALAGLFAARATRRKQASRKGVA